MASTAVIPSGVSIGTAGSGGLLAGDATGFGGLFAAMVDNAAPMLPPGSGGAVPEAAPAGVVSVLLGAPKSDAPAAGPGMGMLGGLIRATVEGVEITTVTVSPGVVKADVKLGDAPTLTVTGEAEVVADFIEQVQVVYQKIIGEGKLTIGQLQDSKELAGALAQMGMAPDEAAGVAERIQTMLALLEQQQDVDDKTAGSLVAMMLAVMGQGMPQQPVNGEPVPQMGLQILSVEETTAVTLGATVTGVVTSKMAGWQVRASSDVTRDLLGLDSAFKDKLAEKVAEAPAAEGEKVRKVEVAVNMAAEAAVGVALPEVKVAPVVDKPGTDAMPSDAAQVAAAVTNTGATVKVAAKEVIEAPQGETLYKLQADKNGVETLDAVKPSADVRDANVTFTQANTAPVQAAVVAPVAGSEFAQRMEQVQRLQAILDKAGVGQQVAVQIQPLLEQGGGTIRMNLNPRELGQVTVELQVVDGRVHGSIAAQDAVVVEQLARELHSLRHGLADAGLKLGDQGINLMLSNQGQQNQQGQGGNHHAQSGTGGHGAEADGDLTVNLAGWVAPDRVLDVNV